VGTGANFPYYPGNLAVTAIDFSRGILGQAQRRAAQLGFPVELVEMDVQSLAFPDSFFDTVVATCVFCTVPDPRRGLGEIRRVLKRGGRLLMAEHVLSKRSGLRFLCAFLTP
jgi:ubiquinone/menaquinone biosynthesis C-methylase UbiE